MCGFAGIARWGGAPVDSDLILRMTRVIAHRGPNGEGMHVGPGIGLGHRRLAIIDTTSAGIQPMCTEDGRLWLAYNGEIYNFRELRAELEGKGYRFRSRTDTEVILYLYLEHGLELVQRLRGMFAFALWDADQRRLLLARDRIGIKPLFYWEGSGEVRFGSEIKTLLVDRVVPRSIDWPALDALLAQRYIAAPQTLLREVRQLEPGEIAIFSENEPLRRHRYWELGFPEDYASLTEKQWEDRLESSLRDAVRTHLMSDVPYGALLSSGIDSAVIVALMRQEHDSETLTFTADFAESTFGEGGMVRDIARSLHAHNEQVVFRPPTLERIQQVVYHAEEPTADMSTLPFFSVCELASRHVRVALSGDGADEILAGYETYQASWFAQRYQGVPKSIRGFISRAAEGLPDSELHVSWQEKLKRFVRGAQFDGEHCHLAWRQICEPELRRELLAGNASRAQVPPGSDVFERCDATHWLNRYLFADTRYYLPSDMLVKADRMSMAHGLEIRVPYLDHPLVELAARIPPRLKLRYLRDRKYLLQKLAKRTVPVELSRKKHGFNIPFSAWLRGPLKETVTDLLSPDRLRSQGLVQPEVVARLLSQHLRGERDRGYELYVLMVISVWFEVIDWPIQAATEATRKAPLAIDAVHSRANLMGATPIGEA